MKESANDWWLLHRAHIRALASRRLSPAIMAKLHAQFEALKAHAGEEWKVVLKAMCGIAAGREDRKTGQYLDEVLESTLERQGSWVPLDPEANATEANLKADPEAWSHAAAEFAAPAWQPMLLATYLCFRLRSLLCIPTPPYMSREPLYVFLRARLDSVVRRTEPVGSGTAPCTQVRADVGALVSIVEPVLCRPAEFAAALGKLDADDRLPACFGSFRFQAAEDPEVAHEEFERALRDLGVQDDDVARHVSQLKAADHLAAMIVDTLLDPMRLDQVEYRHPVVNSRGQHDVGVLIRHLDSVLRITAKLMLKASPDAHQYLARHKRVSSYFNDHPQRKGGILLPGRLTRMLGIVRSLKRRLGLPIVTPAQPPTPEQPPPDPAYHWACCAHHSTSPDSGHPEVL